MDTTAQGKLGGQAWHEVHLHAKHLTVKPWAGVMPELPSKLASQAATARVKHCMCRTTPCCLSLGLQPGFAPVVAYSSIPIPATGGGGL